MPVAAWIPQGETDMPTVVYVTEPGYDSARAEVVAPDDRSILGAILRRPIPPAPTDVPDPIAAAIAELWVLDYGPIGVAIHPGEPREIPAGADVVASDAIPPGEALVGAFAAGALTYRHADGRLSVCVTRPAAFRRVGRPTTHTDRRSEVTTDGR